MNMSAYPSEDECIQVTEVKMSEGTYRRRRVNTSEGGCEQVKIISAC